MSATHSYPLVQITCGLLILITAEAFGAATRYDVTIETAMPHLEESLRYATRREQRCLTRAELVAVFPALDDASLNHCTLGDERRHDGASVWTLACTGGSGTTGRATWRFDGPQITGTLHVKLGGKNMTYWQRVTLQPLGECETRRRR